jgi:hypothetical protein
MELKKFNEEGVTTLPGVSLFPEILAKQRIARISGHHLHGL